jgi:hypothetical protein
MGKDESRRHSTDLISKKFHLFISDDHPIFKNKKGSGNQSPKNTYKIGLIDFSGAEGRT